DPFHDVKFIGGTGRQAAEAAGTMETPVMVPAGTGQTNYKDFTTDGRAGDLSGINVDPVDGSFWAANEFANSEATANWGTAIANFTISTPAHFSLTASPTSTTAGSAFSLTVTALDATNNTNTAYLGTVHFTTSDHGSGVVLP